MKCLRRHQEVRHDQTYVPAPRGVVHVVPRELAKVAELITATIVDAK